MQMTAPITTGFSQKIVIEWKQSGEQQFEELVHWIRSRPSRQQVHVYMKREEGATKKIMRTFQALGCTVTNRLCCSL